ncbi:MAG: IS1182 family transposase [Flavobacteriales bacterium]|nr:IS1182 family transposase [Flavobacteriales bacterium]
MAYRYGDRKQITLLPDSVDQYILSDDPVRVYDTFIDCLDIEELGLKLNDNALGCSSYDPISMLKILVYAYSYGWRGSRKIERALHHNLSFIWLAGGLKPDFKTISNFRKNNLSVLKNVLVQSARLAMKLNLIHGNTLFTDGSKFRANAGNRETKSLEKWSRYEKHVSQRIDQLLEESKSIDKKEIESLVSIDKELKSELKLKAKITGLLKEFKGEERVNGTDPECKIMKGRQGSHAGYNVQSTTDESHGLIVALEGTDSGNDLNALSKQVEIAEKNLEKECSTICADAGYSSIEDLVPLVGKGKTVVVPSQKQAQKVSKEESFSKDKFIYISDKDIYLCPEGKELCRASSKDVLKVIDYKIKNKEECKTCQHFGTCTSAKYGRTLRRSVHEEVREEIAKIYESDLGQEVYSKRKMRAELQFGHFKRNLGAGAFLLRGIKAINAELGILGACFNLSRMITLTGGVRPLINKLVEI